MSNKRNIRFEKVSLERFISDSQSIIDKLDGEIDLVKIYNNITLPVRKTASSAGYDFMLPFELNLKDGYDELLIPTGIRCFMDSDLFLSLYPRSSFGFKYKMKLANTVGIIDADYYGSENEGHIMAKVSFDKSNVILKNDGTSFIQGVFTQYFIANDDDVNIVRTGGMGSTTERK